MLGCLQSFMLCGVSGLALECLCRGSSRCGCLRASPHHRPPSLAASRRPPFVSTFLHLAATTSAVLHIVDGPLTARTPLVEHWSAGQPSANLSAAYEGYSPAAAQAAVDATAMGAAAGSISCGAAAVSQGAAAPTSPSSGSGGSSQAPQPSPSAAVDPIVALSLLRPGGSPASWSGQPAGSSGSSAPSGPAQLALNLSLSLPLEAAATSGQPAAQPAPPPAAAPSPAAPATAASPSPAPAAAPPAEQAQTKSTPVTATTTATQLAATGSSTVPAPPLPPLVVPVTAPPAVLPTAPAPAPIVEPTSGGPNNSSGGAVQAADDQDCVTLRAVVETSLQIFSRVRDVVARFGWVSMAVLCLCL